MFYIFAVLSCKQNLKKAESQYNKYLQDLSKFTNIVYVKFIGDPNIHTEYIYDKENCLLTLKCEDDYLNLPNKIYCFFKAIRELYPDFTNIFKTDDDTNIDLSNLIDLMTYCKDFDYGGYNIWCGETTEWMYGKTEIIEKYPELGRIPILQTKQDYCGGGAYFLSKKSVDIIINNPQFFIPFPKNAYTNYIKVIDGKEHFCNLYLFEDYTIGLVLRRYNKIAVLCIPKDLLSTCVTW